MLWLAIVETLLLVTRLYGRIKTPPTKIINESNHDDKKTSVSNMPDVHQLAAACHSDVEVILHVAWMWVRIVGFNPKP